MFEQAASEMKALTDVVVNELEAQLQANINACLGSLSVCLCLLLRRIFCLYS